MSQHLLAYLSGGKLFVSHGGAAFRAVESEFVEGMKGRLQSIQKRNEWKTSGTGAQFMGVRPSLDGADPSGLVCRFTGMSLCGGSQLRYSLQTESVGGLFDYSVSEREEKRILHKEYFNVSDIDVHPETGETVCSAAFNTGVTNIALVSGNSVEQLTEGDSFDEAPRWIPGSKGRIVFQSAGIARSGEGFYAGHGNTCVMTLDLRAGTLETALEDPAFDFLAPQYDENGSLYCIRRRYEENANRVTLLSSLKDLLFFPVRIVRAVVGYLNFFSMIYSKEPLITAGGNGKKGPDPKTVFLHGRMIDVDKQMKKAEKGDGSLIPSDWELVRIAADGSMKVIAQGVASFDLCGGEVVYSNGTKVFHVAADGTKSRIAEGSCIEKLRWCRA